MSVCFLSVCNVLVFRLTPAIRSTGDSHILRSSALWVAAERGDAVVEGLCVGLDTAYALRPWTATPYRGLTTARQAQYNLLHSRARSRIENVWARYVFVASIGYSRYAPQLQNHHTHTGCTGAGVVCSF